jgi:hypothetical protein
MKALLILNLYPCTLALASNHIDTQVNPLYSRSSNSYRPFRELLLFRGYDSIKCDKCWIPRPPRDRIGARIRWGKRVRSGVIDINGDKLFSLDFICWSWLTANIVVVDCPDDNGWSSSLSSPIKWLTLVEIESGWDK